MSTSERALSMGQSSGFGLEGQVLGGFQLVQEIACGGMAAVYLAHRPGLGGIGQAAAVKVIHPHLARDREFLDMFLDEARLVSCIHHPNVSRVIDFGRSAGTYYLAMEYVLGETWADVLQSMKEHPRAEAFIPVLVAQVLAQACEGLHAAHEARDPRGVRLNIVHRDISPQNLIVGYDGAVRVLDFGVASAAECLHTTRTGAIKGRISFMAPEQARGLPVDRRADVWSLGVLLWEALARRRLFKRDTDAETIMAVTQATLPTLEDCGFPVPPRLARIAMKALDREPDERYPTAREMGLELARFAASSAQPFGVAEVSSWMEQLFARRIQEKHAALAKAARDAAGELSPEDDAPTLIAERFRKRLQASSHACDATPDPGSDDTCLERPRRLPQFSEPPRRRSVPSRTASVAAVAALIGVMLGAWFATAITQRPLQAELLTQAHLREPRPGASLDVARQAPASALEAAGEEPVALTSATPGDRDVLAPSAQATLRPDAGRPQRAGAPAGVGLVAITTPGGWAVVMEGGRRLGTTPGRFKLRAGAHTLEILPRGNPKRVITRTIQVTRARPTKLRVQLKG